MKYFVLYTSGKQFLVKPNEWYDLDYISSGKIGDLLSFKRLILYRDLNKVQLGQPFINNGIVVGKILQNVKGKKLLVLKTKPKKNYTRSKGCRKMFTRIQIDKF
jgi:large subunit ribosomal protein L21